MNQVFTGPNALGRRALREKTRGAESSGNLFPPPVPFASFLSLSSLVANDLSMELTQVEVSTKGYSAWMLFGCCISGYFLLSVLSTERGLKKPQVFVTAKFDGVNLTGW